jgi:ubiquinone/menaquinone biosynthesis C-methylase UbiE
MTLKMDVASGDDAPVKSISATRRYHDVIRGRLIDIHVNEDAAQDYWEHHWSRIAGARLLSSVHTPNNMVIRETRKYLATGAKVLEGGCGIGQNVWGLQRIGYEVWGIDKAAHTLELVRRLEPELRLSIGDVQSLEFPDASFDGYWSLGVIEHFWSGYTSIICEMARVLRSGGYLFLTFPAMNPLRCARAARGVYPAWDASCDSLLKKQFYQYLLPVSEVENDLIAKGFEMVEMHYIDGYKGAKDEFNWLQTMSRWVSMMGLAKPWQKVANMTASSYCGHLALMIMRKK